MFVFGGQDLKEGSFDSVWKLDLQLLSQANDLDDFQAIHWEHVATSGEKPGKFSHHTCVQYEGKMYLFGGIDNEDANKFLYELDLAKSSWSIVE